MAVHDINELKEQELTHQIELQDSYQKLSKALEEVTKQSEIIKSIATLYDTILYEDLKMEHLRSLQRGTGFRPPSEPVEKLMKAMDRKSKRHLDWRQGIKWMIFSIRLFYRKS